MERVENFLRSDERVVHLSRQHPVILLKTGLIWLAALSAAALSGIFLLARTDSPLAEQVVGAVAISATIYAGIKVLQWRSVRYVITGERVMVLSGLLSVRVSSMPLSKVNDVTFSSSLWGRVLGFGDLSLETAGERAGLSRLIFLPRPREVYRLLSSLLDPPAENPHELQVSRQWPGARMAGKDDTGPLPPVV